MTVFRIGCLKAAHFVRNGNFMREILRNLVELDYRTQTRLFIDHRKTQNLDNRF